MIFKLTDILKSIVAIILAAMFFSCTNSTKEVKDFLADKNKPIGVAKNIHHVHKNLGVISSKLTTPLLYDYSNRKKHPYKEFPKGVKIVTINKNGKDSTTISGNYALTYSKTAISEIKGNVVIINHTKGSKLETNQLFWDQKEKYFFTEDGFRLTTPKGVFNGFGFESKQDLTEWVAKDLTGDAEINKKEL